MTVTALCETRAVGNMALGNRGEVDEDGEEENESDKIGWGEMQQDEM